MKEKEKKTKPFCTLVVAGLSSSENCPKSESSRKWLGEGAKGLLDPASKRPLAMGLHQCKRAFAGGARDSWETFAPCAQKSQKDLFAPSPNQFWRLSLFGQIPGPTASQGGRDTTTQDRQVSGSGRYGSFRSARQMLCGEASRIPLVSRTKLPPKNF